MDLWGIVKDLFSLIVGQSLQGSGWTPELVKVMKWVASWGSTLYKVVSLFAWELESARQGMYNAGGAIANTAAQIGAVEAETRLMFRHTYDTIIPETVGQLHRYVYDDGINPLRGTVSHLQGQINAVSNEADNSALWIEVAGKPLVGFWNDFITAWKNTYRPPLDRLIGYFNHPSDFSDWLAPPMVGSLIDYLADPAHKLTRDAITLIVFRAMDEVPDAIETAVEQWLVAEPAS